MRLQRQAPFRRFHRQPDRRPDRFLAPFAIYRLDEEMIELPPLELGGIDPLLRPHPLQLVATPLDNLSARLRADADPVDSRSRRKRSVRLDCNSETVAMQRIDKLGVELEHRFAASDHDQPPLAFRSPKRLDATRNLICAGELAAALAVRAHKIGIAEGALGRGPVLLAPGPQIA